MAPFPISTHKVSFDKKEKQKTKKKTFNACPAEPRYTLPLQTV